MRYGAVLFFAFGLAMDATAVAAARGLAVTRVLPRHVAMVAVFFGGAQATMPLAGFWLGKWVGPIVAAWDHWVVFVLLAAIGGKMVWESRGAPDELRDGGDPFRWDVMTVLAVATSVDAFAAGLTLPMLDAPLLASIATIGITTALLSAAGLFAGRRFGAAIGKRLDAIGGLMLIALGTKTLAEHLVTG